MNITIKKPTAAEIKSMQDKPIWSCEVSKFDWHYDETEVCLVLEGEVEVTTAIEKVKFGVGDLVTFPKGLDCVWDVKKTIKKHYIFL